MAETSPPRLIPQLPDEISIQCIARVPRLLQPSLALVSRSWHSLLNSPLLFSVRSELGVSRRFICFSVQLSGYQSQWFLLDPDPESPRPLLRLPSPPVPTVVGYACTALGPTIFVIGGKLNGIRSRVVQIFDTRHNQWSIGPPMAVARKHAVVGAIGGRIYAIGGHNVLPYDSLGEVLDPDLSLWTSMPCPTHLQEKKRILAGSVFGGKLYIFGSREGGVVFDPELETAWSAIPSTKDLWLQGREVVVDGVLFTFTSKGIEGYDHIADKWMPLHGLDRNQGMLSALDDVGGILCGIWVPWSSWSGNMMVLEFAGIKVSRKSCGEFWGSLVWTKSVVLPEKGYFTGHCVELEL